MTGTLNRFGCVDADVLAKFTTGSYTPTAAELGGTTVIGGAIDSAVDQIIQAMPEEVFKQLTRVDLEFIVMRATANQATATLTLKPATAGQTYVWKGQPRFFKERPYKSTDLVPDEEFFDPSTYRPLSELTEGTAYTIDNTTGIITFAAGYLCAANDQVVVSYVPVPGSLAVASLATCAADGAAYLLGSKLYPRASSQWQYMEVLQEQFTTKLAQLGDKTWIPPELRLMNFWKEVEPANGDGARKINVGRIVRA